MVVTHIPFRSLPFSFVFLMVLVKICGGRRILANRNLYFAFPDITDVILIRRSRRNELGHEKKMSKGKEFSWCQEEL